MFINHCINHISELAYLICTSYCTHVIKSIRVTTMVQKHNVKVLKSHIQAAVIEDQHLNMALSACIWLIRIKLQFGRVRHNESMGH